MAHVFGHGRRRAAAGGRAGRPGAPVSEGDRPFWRHPDFLRLWTGQSISQLGSQVSALALPLTAALALGAGPIDMGVLGAAQTAPWLLIGPLAGVWVDRWPRRPVLVAAELGRALLLAS